MPRLMPPSMKTEKSLWSSTSGACFRRSWRVFSGASALDLFQRTGLTDDTRRAGIHSQIELPASVVGEYDGVGAMLLGQRDVL